MLRLLQVLLLASCVTNIAGKTCITASGQKTCTQGAGDCQAGSVCMKIQNGKSNTFRTICGEPQAEGCFCDKNLVSSEACEENLSCQEEKGKYKCQQSHIIKLNCNSSWELIYHNGRFGESKSGTVIVDLVQALKDGAEVKVWTAVFGLIYVQKGSTAFDEDNNVLRVHGQSLFWVKPSLIRPYNLFFVFSTSGNVHMTQFFIGNATNDVRVNSNFPTEMKWYVRKMSAKVENDKQLLTAVKDGANIRVESDHEVRHLEVPSVAEDTVQGVSVWEMRDELRGLQFNTTEQWLHKHWSLDGTVQKAWWLVNTHQMNESESLNNAEITWYVDTCWKLVYRHNCEGQTLSGSWSRLHDDVKKAKRVKVRIGTEFFEANSLHVTNDDIILHVYDSVDFNVSEGFWKWHVVSTSGLVKTYTVGLGNDKNVTSSTIKEKQLSWFVEDREWTSVAADNRDSALQAAIKAGSDVRFRAQLDEGDVWYQADVLSRELGAYNERELVVDGNQYLRRYTFAYWETNKITQIDFPVGETGPFSYQERSVNIDWFTG